MNTPPHPADFLNEVLMPVTGRSDGEIARLLGISLQVFYTILTREKPISPKTAKMLGRLFGTGDEFWLKMQADYDRFMGSGNVVDCAVAPPELAQRPAPTLPPPTPIHRAPKPVPGFAPPADLPASDFPPAGMVTDGRFMVGSGLG